MKAKHIILTLLLVSLVFFGTVVLFIFQTFDSNPSVPRNDTQTPTENPTQTATTSTATSSGVSTPPPSADAHDPIAECAAFKSSQVGNKDFEKGSLLVSFYDSVNYNLALDIIELLGLRAEESATARNNFNSRRWLTVSVPEGSEFEWRCRLETSEGIKGTTLNYSFELWQ